MPEFFTLPNGLRVIITPSHSNVCYAGIAVAAGTRHELDSESGMAHFVEHMNFKGTSHLSSLQVLNRMDRVGGDLNAYTGKEETIFYATFLREHLGRALTLLYDIVFHSTFPQHELEKEREVVIDEIRSYDDSPAELIYEDFEALLFPGHPLGRHILGEAESLRRYQTADLHAFVRRCYSPDKAVLFIKGGGDTMKTDVRRLLQHLTATSTAKTHEATKSCIDSSLIQKNTNLSTTSPTETACTYPSEDNGRGTGTCTILSKSTHQAHVMLGARAYALTDPRFIGLALLSNLLGGPAMNSRLSLALRERTGLVYAVESAINGYSDTGTWTVYFGCDHADVQRCLRLVRRELLRLTTMPLTARQLDAARRQLKGQMGIAADNAESVALSTAKYYLFTGQYKSLEERSAALDALTPAALHGIALDIFDPDRLTTLIYE